MNLHLAERIILHVDMDCFFAAVEEREDPSLKGKPVIVGSDPKGGRGRGIVATCNYEARKFGVRSALPISTAFRRCPRGIYLQPDFSRYTRASRAVMEILRPAADIFEPAGIDEAYLDVSSQGTFEAARELARQLQAQVRIKERLSCSIGAGPNKLIAKLASDHKKPGGLTVVIPSRVQEFLGPKEVRSLRGVGPKTEERLHSLGIKTVVRLRALSREALRAHFGSFGDDLYDEARGVSQSPVDPLWERKSFGREDTFEEDTGNIERAKKTLLDCLARSRRDMLEEGHWCRTITVKVRYEGYETHSRQTTLRLPTARLDQLERAALDLADPFLRAGRKLRLVGCSLSKLCPPEELLPL
ncbi:MAG: DNA polymerase IV [Elusimicrobiota bacterium]|jgi:nucleotidyltransferase/DNA polymerase involved in DNA repair